MNRHARRAIVAAITTATAGLVLPAGVAFPKPALIGLEKKKVIKPTAADYMMLAMPMLTTGVGKYPAIGGSGGYSTEAQQFIDRTTSMSTTDKNNLAALIDAIVAINSGTVWSQLRGLWIVNDTKTNFAQNLKSSSFTLTENNTTDFTPYVGTACNASDNAYWATGINPASVGSPYAQNSLLHGYYINESFTGDDSTAFTHSGCYDGACSIAIYPRSGSGGAVSYATCNSGTFHAETSPANLLGTWATRRQDGTDRTLDYRSTTVTGGENSVQLTNAELWLCVQNNNGTPSTGNSRRKKIAWFSGGYIGDSDMHALAVALNNYANVNGGGH